MTASKTRREPSRRSRIVQGAMVPIATALTVYGMLDMGSPHQTMLQYAGIAAALLTASVTAHLHLVTSWRETRLATILSVTLVVGLVASATGVALADRMSRTTLGIALLPFIVAALAMIPLSIVIAVKGMKAKGHRKTNTKKTEKK